MNKKEIFNTLILEDDIGLRKVIASDFKDIGHEVVEADELGNVPNRSFDFAVIDLRLNGESGLNVINKLKTFNQNCRIVVLTGFGSIATAIEAINLGAVNYLTKPANFEQIVEALEIKKAKYELANESMSEEEAKRISLSRNEYEYINFVLTQNNGNISKTARELGLHRQSLQRKLKKQP